MRFLCTDIEWDAYDEDEELQQELPEEYEIEVDDDDLEYVDDDDDTEDVIADALATEFGHLVLDFDWEQVY